MSDFQYFELWNLLEAACQEYQEEREKYWKGLGPDQQIHYERSESFAGYIYKCCQSLFSEDDIDDGLKILQYELSKIYAYERGDIKKEYLNEIEAIMNTNKTENEKAQALSLLAHETINNIPEDPCDINSPLRLVWESLCYHYSQTVYHENASRAIKIFQLILNKIPSRPTMFYLSRLCRCYICQFDVECLIICRSVLESALNDRIKYDDCEKVLGPLTHYKKEYSLKDKIAVAKKMKLVDDGLVKKIDSVRLKGNNAVHKATASKDVFKTIEDTITVMTALDVKY